MRARNSWAIGALGLTCLVGACQQSQPVTTPEEIIALERGALDRWSKGDTKGYLELYAPRVTYFDPFAAERLDGLPAVAKQVAPIDGKFSIARYEIANPNVEFAGDGAVLTFNLINYQVGPDKKERELNRWNCTEFYRRIDGQWKIVHVHWSFTLPKLAAFTPTS